MAFRRNARRTWKKRDEQGIGSVIADMQQAGRVKLDNSFIGVRIEYLSSFDIDKQGKEKVHRWCSGVIEEISGGSWLKTNILEHNAGAGRKTKQQSLLGSNA